MKTTCFTILALSLTSFGLYQTSYGDFIDDSPKNEFQINALNLLIFSALDLSYEHIINDESSLGVSMLISLDGTDRFGDYSNPYYYEGFTISPYYRIYFGNKPFAGFFVETFVMFSKGHYDYYSSYDTNCYDCLTFDDYYSTYKLKPFTELGIGFAVGAKFLTRRNFSVSILGGVARNFLTSHGPGVAPKIGISLGRRF
jgi:hypothetical protein